MATLTFTDTTDFGAIANCSIESGSIRPGVYNFSADDTGTGLDDWASEAGSNGSVTPADGSVAIRSKTVFEGISANPGTLSGIPAITLADSVNGDCDVRVRMTSPAGPYPFIALYEDANDYHAIYRFNSGAWSNRSGMWVAGARAIGATNESALSTDAGYLRFVRTSNDFQAFTSPDGTTWTALNTFTQARAASLGLMVGADYHTSQQTITVESVRIAAGFTGIAQAYIGDCGTGSARHIDAGAGNKPVLSTAAHTLTNATATYDIKSNDTGTFDGLSWDATGLTLAQFQSHDNGQNRYSQIRVNLTTTGATPSLDAFSVETAFVDVTPPSDATATTSRISGTGESTRAVVAWTNGTDTGGAGFKGSTVELEVANVWYILKTDGSWAETASTADTDYEYIGTSGSKEGVLVDSEEGPTGFSSATRARITGYDNADNANDLILTVSSDDFPEVGNVTTDDTVNGVAGTFVAPTAAQVESGVLFGANGTEFTGTLAPGGDAPSVPDLAVEDNADGTLTLSLTGADTGTSNAIQSQPVGGRAWSTRAILLGNGSTTIAHAPGWHTFTARSTGSGGTSHSLAHLTWVLDPDRAPDFAEVRLWVRGRLASASALVSELDSADRIRARETAGPADAPAVRFDLAWTPLHGAMSSGPFRIDGTIDLIATSHAALDRMARAVIETFAGGPFATARWSLRQLSAEVETVDGEAPRDEDGHPFLTRRIRLRFRAATLSTITFTHEAETLTLPAPEPNAETEERRQQSTAQTADGTRFVYDAGADARTERLAFASLTRSEADQLGTFFHNRAGQQQSFTYTDVDSAAHTVRFAEPRLAFEALGTDCINVTLTLRME